MARHLPEPHGPRRHVLVLLPERARDPHLVEEVHHHDADHSIRSRPRYALRYPHLHLSLIH
jgi:hypothetical protein